MRFFFLSEQLRVAQQRARRDGLGEMQAAPHRFALHSEGSTLVVVGKVVGVSLGAFLTGNSVRTSVQAGMSLAQIGEFSFIIAALLSILVACSGSGEPVEEPGIDVIDVSGPLDASALEFMNDSIEGAAASGQELAVLQINSRAVLDDRAFTDLLETLENPPLPLAVWVGPAPAVAGGGAAQPGAVARARHHRRRVGARLLQRPRLRARQRRRQTLGSRDILVREQAAAENGFSAFTKGSREIVVAFRPEWLASWSDARYLPRS